jgi:hypothetical protein
VLQTTIEPEACDIEAASVALKMYKAKIPDLQNTTLGYGFHFQHRISRTFPIESLVHDRGRTLLCAEYGYLEGFPTVKEEIRLYSSKYSARLSAHPNDLIVKLIELPDNRRF